MPERQRPFRASYLVSGIEAARVFAALLDVWQFPVWAAGLRRSRALDAAGKDTTGVRPGVRLEFILSAAGFTHRVLSTVTVVEPPRQLEWDYLEGAVGEGGWFVEEEEAESVRMTLWTDYRLRPFFRGLIEDLIRRSMRRLEAHLREG